MNQQPVKHRDEELGAALRELDVPGHAPGFNAELRRRLDEERVIRLPVDRRRSPRWGVRIAAAAAVAGAAALAIGLPRADRSEPIAGPEVATAAEIKAQVRASLLTLRSLSGELVSDGPRRGDTSRWRFTVTSEGDVRLVGPGEHAIVTYDAASAVMRSAQTSASIGGDTLFYAERRGVAPGPPDQNTPRWVLPSELGAYVRALLGAEDPRVRSIAYGGRPAWRLEVPVKPNAIVPEFSGDHLAITVDRATGFPVHVVESKAGELLRELRIEDLALNGRVEPDAFRLRFPAGAEVMRSDDGFRRVDLEDAAAIVGYAPLRPAWVPEGYELEQVAVAEEAGPTGTEAGNPPSRMVVSLEYRRGLDQLLVTTRLSGGERWDDPLATGEGFRDDPEGFVPRRGALTGADAELVIEPRGIPHVWALADGLVVTVGGDLTRTELIRVAESLRTG